MTPLFDIKDALMTSLISLARVDPRVCIVLNDSLSSSKAHNFLDEFPERLFDVGIAEQNMVGVAAGLANSGLIPFVCSASCFLTGRALEQIKVDVALSNANVKLCGFNSGFSYGSMGATHHSTEDVAWIRALPRLKIAVPCDDIEMASVIRTAYEHQGPVFIRINRLPVPRLFQNDHKFEFGTAMHLREGRDLTLISFGLTTSRALVAAELLSAHGIECRVINMSSVVPLDSIAITNACRETGRIVCLEDHQLAGGLFSAVSEIVVQNMPVAMLGIGVPGVFAPVSDTEELLELFDLEPQKIARRVIDWLREA
ncbi:transketolase C-terminal domain-containing protein [Serratia fonticola]|uniref:transketolase family protein n=1 Tax=Serratia fonticola TaxID=47917 RepID=UPI0015C62927|nr:transketolase C-terminal domain-containing protein [Serratia fonticola]NYA45450.1 transketolase family protein [Serratia fonticola]